MYATTEQVSIAAQNLTHTLGGFFSLLLGILRTAFCVLIDCALSVFHTIVRNPLLLIVFAVCFIVRVRHKYPKR